VSIKVKFVPPQSGQESNEVGWDQHRSTPAKRTLTAIAQSDIVLTKGKGTGEYGNWVFEFSAESVEYLSDFQRYCRESDIDITLNRVFTLAEMRTGGEYNLTPEQHGMLVLAFNEGYYNDPTETNLGELAGILRITHPSVSSRLKYGYRNLIDSTLIHTEDSK
jgi:predicted DNA binding protein